MGQNYSTLQIRLHVGTSTPGKLAIPIGPELMPTLQTQHSPRFAPEGQEQACMPEDTQEDVHRVLLRIIKNWMTKMSVKGPSQKGLKDLKS